MLTYGKVLLHQLPRQSNLGHRLFMIPYFGFKNSTTRTYVNYDLCCSKTINTNFQAKIMAPEFDQYVRLPYLSGCQALTLTQGMVMAQSLDQSDPSPARPAIASPFPHPPPSLSAPAIDPSFTFLIHSEALGDRNADVRK